MYCFIAERSMAESISVALRVAKDAIDEAITKAEKQTGNQVLIWLIIMVFLL